MLHLSEAPDCSRICHPLQGSEEQKSEAALVLLAVLETVRIVAVMLSPITPALAQRVYLQLGFSEAEAGGRRWEHAQWGGKSCVCELCYCEPALFSACLTCLNAPCQLSGFAGLKDGQSTPKPTPVFQRLEGDFVTQPAATASAA